jgi:hypothetical protein
MPHNSSTNDPKTIWQNQLTEPSKMTLTLINQKTQQLHGKTRRELFNSIAVSLFVVGFSIFGITRIDGAVARGAFAVAIAWALAGLYFINRGNPSDSAPAGAALSTSLDSYRREVERQRHLSNCFLLWTFGPTVLAVGALSVHLLTIASGRGQLRNTVPFFTLLGLWFVSVFVIRMWKQRELQREIDELTEVERSNNT